MPTPVPTVSSLPAPLPTSACVVVDEGLDDASIGAGWSDTAVTLYEGPSGTYGYVHGNCASCDENAGVYGFFPASTDLSKSLSDLPAHSRVRVSMRVWALDDWDYGNIYISVGRTLDYLFATRHAQGWCLGIVETMAVSMFCRTLDSDAAATALQVFHFMFTVSEWSNNRTGSAPTGGGGLSTESC